MSLSLESWLESIKPLQKMVKDEPEKYYSETFFRDPLIPQMVNCDYIYSPASGIIVDQAIVKPDEKIVDIKGIEYTPQHLIDDCDFDKKSLVISVFMSQFSVHVNRIPTDGNLFWKFVSPLQTLNRPMLFEEKDILKGIVNYSDMNYPVNNGRVINTIYNGLYKYYLVQIADSDVNVIAPFSREQGTHFFQNERFSVVRYGSQVSLILPLTDSFEFELCEKVERVVEAGIDKLLYLKSKVYDQEDKFVENIKHE